jgi:hypothetical protein
MNSDEAKVINVALIDDDDALFGKFCNGRNSSQNPNTHTAVCVSTALGCWCGCGVVGLFLSIDIHK